MATRRTRKPVSVTLTKDRRIHLDELVEIWSMDQKKFILQTLEEYSPSIKVTKNRRQRIKDFLLGRDEESEKKEASHLANPKIFRDSVERFKITGEQNPKKAMHKIYDMEISPSDRTYLLHVLKQETDDIYIPQELINLFAVGHRRHHQSLLMEEGAPKAPFYLILGPTGSGKSVTIKAAIDKALFDQGIEFKQKVDDDLEDILKKYPFMARFDLEAVAPETAERLAKERRMKKVKFRSRIPIVRRWYKEEMAKLIEKDEGEFGMDIDVEEVHPNNVQTMWYGETGNKMKASFGKPGTTSIRILEEAHALLGKHESHGAQVQEETLVSTFNLILDEIEQGKRNCMVVAITRKGEDFYEDIYRRFQEKGKIIDMNDYWKDPETIDELIKIEVLQQDIAMPTDDERRDLAGKVLDIFEYRGLDVTPAYVRKLIANIAEMKGELKMDYLEDGILVREAFVNVARNLYSEMFGKTYNRLTRGVDWDEYVGDVKEEFQRSVNQCLIHDLSAEKGAVLAGPPGTGKTFLARVYLSRNPEIADVTLKMEDLQDKRDPIDGPVRKLAQAFDIAKMCAPSLLFIDEGETVAMERQGNIGDRITNKLLNAVGGETELKGVYVVLTTNKPKHLAEAATRSKRLRVMPITGRLNEKDIYKMVDNNFKEEAVSDDLRQRVYSIARQICNTPADYSAFFETIVNFKNEESKVIRYAAKLDENQIDRFIETNYKVLLGIAESLGFSDEFVMSAKKDASHFMDHKDELLERIREAAGEDYPITKAHLERAKEDRIKTPAVKGRLNLDDYLEGQLSTEPQVGFVIGAGATETMGLLVPISSSLVYGEDYRGDKIVVTGAVNVSAPQAAELNAAVEMMKQSSSEALTLIYNYLDSLLPGKDVNRIIGTYLKDNHFHHQFLTAQYLGGGPSAGMALAINTMSVILGVPVRNDFGITGAPWSRGRSKKDVGSAVIIGGTHHKAQVVLSYLDRMYVPVQNVKDLDLLTLEGYWSNGKDVVGYQSFPTIVGEVYQWEPELEGKVQELFEKRVEAKRQELVDVDDSIRLFAEVAELSQTVRERTENLIRGKILAIEQYLKNSDREKFVSLEDIFASYKE